MPFLRDPPIANGLFNLIAATLRSLTCLTQVLVWSQPQVLCNNKMCATQAEASKPKSEAQRRAEAAAATAAAAAAEQAAAAQRAVEEQAGDCSCVSCTHTRRHHRVLSAACLGIGGQVRYLRCAVRAVQILHRNLDGLQRRSCPSSESWRAAPTTSLRFAGAIVGPCEGESFSLSAKRCAPCVQISASIAPASTSEVMHMSVIVARTHRC